MLRYYTIAVLPASESKGNYALTRTGPRLADTYRTDKAYGHTHTHTQSLILYIYIYTILYHISIHIHVTYTIIHMFMRVRV